MANIGLVSLVVRDYDEAINFYVGKLGFELIEDTALSLDKRWVVVRPEGAHETGLLLAKGKSERELGCVGNQTGGRVALFLETEDIEMVYAKYCKAGVIFKEALRHETYGIVAVFEDLYGNLWDLIERR